MARVRSIHPGLLILLAVAFLAYDRTTPRVSGRLRVVLTALRAAA